MHGDGWTGGCWVSLRACCRLDNDAGDDIRFDFVKPCARCKVVTIDQSTAVVGKEPLRTLSVIRWGNEVQDGVPLKSTAQQAANMFLASQLITEVVYISRPVCPHPGPCMMQQPC